MKLVFLATVLVIGCICCTHPKKPTGIAENVMKESNSIPERWKSEIDKFSIRLDSKMPDENELLFLCSRVFDTSYLIHLRKERDRTIGTFYEILPTYHRNINDFADENDQLLFFEGYSFKIDSARWAKVAEIANKIVNKKVDTVPKYTSCIECPSYYLMHNSKRAFRVDDNVNDFELFAKYLSDSLLSKYVSKWKPVLHK